MKTYENISSHNEITAWLANQKDDKYKDFSSKLIPDINKNRFIGVRIPVIRKFAKEISGTQAAQDFISSLPHHYIEENHLHAFLIENEMDYQKALLMTKKFVCHIDNWSVCDSFRPKVFKNNLPDLYTHIVEFVSSEHTYTKRFGIGLLLSFYLDDAFDEKHLRLVADIKSDEYYINMMIAWYFATALAKQPTHTIPYIENKILSDWVHNKTITKACESFRIDKDTKNYLRTLRINTRRCAV